ncbi:Zinc transporter [Hypoxylon texense]
MSSEGSETVEVHEEPTQCERVGEPMPDIAGFGVLLGLSVQAFISLVLAFWVFFWTKVGRLSIQHPEGTAEHATEKKRLGFVNEILMVGNDLQMITGVALIITTLADWQNIDLYHLRLVYETVSFVGISNAAALVCWTFVGAKTKTLKTKSKNKFIPAHWTPRFRVSYVFGVLFLVLTIFLEVRLDQWSLTAEETGFCYVTTGLTTAGASHPVTDKAYVAVTATWLLLVVFGALFCSVHFRKPLLILGGLQFPLHLYMMIKLRTENQPFLEGEGGESEGNWDFGQTTATLLLGLAIGQLVHQAVHYVKFERNLKKHGAEYALAQDDEKSEPVVSLVEEGLRQVQELKQAASEPRVLRGASGERHEESYELMRNHENRA